MKNDTIHLENVADNWENASPVGNGSCGIMVYGGVDCDKLTLNEETIWSGTPVDHKMEKLPGKIAHIRQMFLEGRDYEANMWIRDNIDEVKHVESYEYAGNLMVSLQEDSTCQDYTRDLDLIQGVCRISYRRDETRFLREYFASMNHGLLCAKYTASEAFQAGITLERENLISNIADAQGLHIVGQTAVGDHRFAVEIRVVTDGTITTAQNSLAVANATCLEIYTAIVTAFRSESYIDDAKAMLSAADAGWDQLLAESTEAFAAYMTRSDITFADGDPALEALTVSQRLQRLKDDPEAEDPGLISLYWQFGKYLLVGSSCPRAYLPANLQGVWADGIKSPWNADYHTNINLQMNYWHAEQANLSDCTEPLFRYMNDFLLPGGKEAAAGIYNTRGMVVHHLSDIYQFAAFADGPWGIWPLGGAWLACHMWEHYLYTKDLTFLRDTAYTYIREAVLFWIDNLFPDAQGVLHTGPSTSPENPYLAEYNGKQERTYNTISPTMDVEIVGALLDLYVEMETILGLDPETAAIAAEKRSKMLPLRVGKYGQLMEWYQDFEEAEPGHRHISHSFGLYPGSQIQRNTPELYKAIEVTLDRRLSSGGGHTGWSRAWLINLFARLRNGDKVYENIRALFTKSTLPNLFDTHPPFQIDGNFGGAAGIGEMLVQSHEGFISLLPAVSPKLANGSFRGLRARGGITLSANWSNGRITHLELTPDHPCNITVEFENGEKVTVYADKTLVLDR